MFKLCFLCFAFLFMSVAGPEFLLPVKSSNRKTLGELRLTDIGNFGLLRKARPGVPPHFHTGIDIRRPSKNYKDEPVFPLMEGVVISKRTDGPYAQLILEHKTGNKKIWTVYEHIAGVLVNLNERVQPATPIARFMNENELNKYGQQFDHLHFEILKIEPKKIKPVSTTPFRMFSSYTLVCFKREDLEKYFYDPIEFMRSAF